jgi:hypothetical protein
MEWTLGFEDPMSLDAIRQVAISIAPDKVISTLVVDHPTLDIGEIATISAHVAIADTTPVANTAVHLQELNAQHGWENIADGITDQNGNIVFKAIFGADAQLRVTTDASWSKAASTSTAQPLSVNASLAISHPTSVKANSAFVVTGQLTPHTAGVSITLTGGDLPTPLGALTDSNGNFSFILPGGSPGFEQFQLTSQHSPQLSSTASASFTVLVR